MPNNRRILLGIGSICLFTAGWGVGIWRGAAGARHVPAPSPACSANASAHFSRASTATNMMPVDGAAADQAAPNAQSRDSVNAPSAPNFLPNQVLTATDIIQLVQRTLAVVEQHTMTADDGIKQLRTTMAEAAAHVAQLNDQLFAPEMDQDALIAAWRESTTDDARQDLYEQFLQSIRAFEPSDMQEAIARFDQIRAEVKPETPVQPASETDLIRLVNDIRDARTFEDREALIQRFARVLNTLPSEQRDTWNARFATLPGQGQNIEPP